MTEEIDLNKLAIESAEILSKLPRNKQEAFYTMVSREIRRRSIPDDSYTPKARVQIKEGSRAYTIVLEDGVTALEALEKVAEEMNKPDSWIDEVKYNKFYVAGDVVLNHDNHPIQKAMIKDGSMDRQALKAADTPTKQLGKLHKQRKLHDTLNNHKSRIDNLEVKTLHLETDMDNLKSIAGLTDKGIAKVMKEAGYTQERIAKHLGKGLRTIQRWWQDI